MTPSLVERRGAGRAKGRILVIDADPLTRETLVRMLQRASYDVVGVSGGRQALRLLDEDPFDLVDHDRIHVRSRPPGDVQRSSAPVTETEGHDRIARYGP